MLYAIIDTMPDAAAFHIFAPMLLMLRLPLLFRMLIRHFVTLRFTLYFLIDVRRAAAMMVERCHITRC